jgi:hypothetical protein
VLPCAPLPEGPPPARRGRVFTRQIPHAAGPLHGGRRRARAATAEGGGESGGGAVPGAAAAATLRLAAATWSLTVPIKEQPRWLALLVAPGRMIDNFLPRRRIPAFIPRDIKVSLRVPLPAPCDGPEAIMINDSVKRERVDKATCFLLYRDLS